MTDEQAIDWINANAPADLGLWIHDRLNSLVPMSVSVIRVRYRLDLRSVRGPWENVEVRSDEATARRDETKWRAWLSENRNRTWNDIRIVKETTAVEVLQNAKLSHEDGGKEQL